MTGEMETYPADEDIGVRGLGELGDLVDDAGELCVGAAEGVKLESSLVRRGRETGEVHSPFDVDIQPKVLGQREHSSVRPLSLFDVLLARGGEDEAEVVFRFITKELGTKHTCKSAFMADTES